MNFNENEETAKPVKDNSSLTRTAAAVAFVGLVSVAGFAPPAVAQVEDAASKVGFLRIAVSSPAAKADHSILQGVISRHNTKQIAASEHSMTHSMTHSQTHSQTPHQD
jgi:hypothetical protein